MGTPSNMRAAVVAMLALIILFAGIPFSVTAGEDKWSVDLHSEMKEWRGKDGGLHRPTVGLAASQNVIAVAVGNPKATAPAANERDNPYGGTWEVTLLLFDANNGKLKKKSGPWSGDSAFELYPTAAGNFLLFLHHVYSGKQNTGETLYLLSSGGEELKKVELAPSFLKPSKPGWSEFFVSPGGHTVLLGQILEGTVHYRLLESDTLETKFEWTDEAGSKSPRIIAISDKEILGFGALERQEERRGAFSERDVYVRSFDGPWLSLHTSLDVSSHGRAAQVLHPTQLAFLSDDALVAVHEKRKESEGSIVVLQSDGTILSPPVIPKLPDRTSLTGPVAVSAGGRYFAVGFQHQPWISHQLVDVMKLDITFWDDDGIFLVWEATRPEPVAKIPVGTELRALSFSTDDSATLAFVTGSILEVMRIEPKAGSSKTH